MPCPRCPCGAYVIVYASKIGHVCAQGDPWPKKHVGQGGYTGAAKDAIIAMRATGATLAECGAQFGLTRERIRQIVNASGVPLCKGCKLPTDLIPGRLICANCLSAERKHLPSRQKFRTGYRKSSRRKHSARLVRLVNQGLTASEIADQMGMLRTSVISALYRMRKRGKNIRANRKRE